jgi:predicted DNA-binding protein
MAKRKPKMKVYGFRLDDKKIAFLDRWAKREGKTRSEILRSTLEAYARWDRDLIDRILPETILTLKDPHGS